MKAAVFHEPGQKLVVESLPDPVPGENQIVLKVGRCGICGSDIHMTESHGVLTPGSVLGHEFAGEIIEVGKNITHLHTGDRVTALPLSACGHCASCKAGEFFWCKQSQFTGGGFAEYALADAASTLKLPDILSLEDGALVEPIAVALHAVRLVEKLENANVLVVGAGPIGLAAAYWARRKGAAKVAITAASRRRQALAEATGVEHFVVNDSDATQTITSLFGSLPDIVIECVGLPGTIERSIELVRPRGTVIVAGACVAPDRFTPLTALVKELRLLFSIMYTVDDFRTSIDALDSGALELRAMITRIVGMDEFVETFESLRGSNPHCKVMLSPWA
jgi:(R,R)-butanediol dehydrogenase/meso-butanediol dehydrogenase/diacetyl reductase